MEKYFDILFAGHWRNLYITFLSMLLPLGIGILLSYFASKKKTASAIFHWVSLPFECLCPMVTLTACFYHYWAVFSNSDNLLPSIALIFSICFMGYMPARFNNDSSFLKNILYNGLGLFSTIYKWSFCASLIGMADLYDAARTISRVTSQYNVFWIPFLMVILVLIDIEIGRRIIMQKMK